MDNLLSVENLKMYLKSRMGIVKAVDDVTLKIDKGESIGLVGESGCGKSMTARSIMRLIPRIGRFMGGKILFENRNILKMSQKEMEQVRGKGMSMIFQEPTTYLNPIKRVGDQIAEGMLHHKLAEKTEVKRRVVEQISNVGIPSPEQVARMFPHQLSGGMQQRILISLALVCHPKLLLADEPSSSLDATVQAQILDIIRREIDERGISMLLITHDLGIVADLTDRIYVMYAGKVVEHAKTLDIFRHPIHPYTEGLLRSVLSIDRFQRDFTYIKGNVPDLVNLPRGCRFHPRCSFAKPICSKQEPPYVEPKPGHGVSCWTRGSENICQTS